MALDLTTKEKRSAYTATHMWMRYHYGKPQKCENCSTTEKRMYHWANVSGTYLRERTDWLRLCVPCHKSHDVKALGGKIKARQRMVQPTKVCTECHIEFFKNPKLSKTQWEGRSLCGKACAGIVTGRLRKGITQSEATKQLKSEKLRERWATNLDWRTHVTNKMIGNQYARKHKKVI